MRNRLPMIGVSLALLLAGCGSVGSSVDGRSVTGKCLIYATMTSNGQVATVNLDGNKIQVTASELRWEKDGSLRLPANWSRLELAEAFDGIAVNVDGSQLAKISSIQ